jgi:hypothetical protein
MAGSITKKVYTGDDGVDYVIRIDESNAEAEISDFDNSCCEDLTTALPSLPRGLKPRYVLATLVANKLIRRKFVIGDTDGIAAAITPGATLQASYGTNGVGEPNAATTWNITYYSGERRPVESFANSDTGLLDGDNQ